MEQVREERADNAAFGMVALPALVAIPAQTHSFDATLAIAFALVYPNSLAAFPRRDIAAAAVARWALAEDLDAFDAAGEGPDEGYVGEVVLEALRDLERFFELEDALLEVVVVDEVAVAVLQAGLAGLQGGSLPVLLLGFFASIVAG